MCCFFAVLLFFGPRLGFLVFWLFPYGQRRVTLSFRDFNYPWLVGILGLVFVPWFTLMYVLVYPLNGFDWVWLGLALGADIASYIGGDRNRHKVPGYSNVMPGDVPPAAVAAAAVSAPAAKPAAAPAAAAPAAAAPAPAAPPATPPSTPPATPPADEGEKK